MFSEHVAHPPLRKCTIVSDSIAKNVSGIWDTQITAFPGINISRLSFRISQGQVDLRSAYVILHVGTNDVTGPRSEDEIISSFNDLISNVRQQSSGSIIVSAIIPRPIDFDTTGNRVKNLNWYYYANLEMLLSLELSNPFLGVACPVVSSILLKTVVYILI